MNSRVAKLINNNRIAEVIFENSVNGMFIMLLPEPITWEDKSEAEKEQLLDFIFENQVVAHCNMAFLDLNGIDPTNTEILTPKYFFRNDKGYYKEIWHQIYSKGQLNVQSFKTKRDGTPLHVDGTYQLIFNDSNQILGHFGIQQDVTSQKNLEIELLNAVKMREKFIDILSHDLKMPVANIIGLLDLFEKAYDAHNQRDYTNELFSMLKTSTSYLDEMLQNMLVWSRSHGNRIPFKPEKHQLSSIVDRCVEPYVDIARSKSIELIFDKEIECPHTLFVDLDMINTIIINLITNAIKFTPKGGSITVKYLDNDVYDVISVSDTGKGISESKLSKLFKVGEIVSSPGTNGEKGSGLGLLIIDDFIKRHHGKIEVSSELGKGSTFTCYLPKLKS